MKKFIITEHERKNILGMYGLIKEQEVTPCHYSDWVNGDGIKKPKVTITPSVAGVTGVYKGPESGFCINHLSGNTGDTIHQLAGVVAREVTAKYLKELYRQGTYVKPDLNGINMLKADNFFQIDIPFIKTTEDKAITNFNERGGMGHEANDTFQAFMATIENNKRYGLIETVKKVASGGRSNDITEHFVAFRDLKDFPIKTQPSQNNTPNTNQTQSPQNNNKKPASVKGNDLLDLRVKLTAETKNISIDVNSIKVDMNNYTVSYNYGDTKIQKLSLLFDDRGDLYNRLESILIDNPTMKVLKDGKINKNGKEYQWALSIIPY